MKKRLLAFLTVLTLIAPLSFGALAEEVDATVYDNHEVTFEENTYSEDPSVTEDPDPSSDSVPADESSQDQGQTLEELLGIDYSQYPKTMYVYTDNGGTLHVRSEPRKGDNIIGELNYGASVTVLGPVVIDASWMVIQYSSGPDGVAYVMARFLVSGKPRAKAKTNNTSASGQPKTTKTTKTRNQEIIEQNMAELNRQLASARLLDRPLLAVVRTTRSSGWINFRVGPGVVSENISPLPDGRELKIIGETISWYQAVDQMTGKTGYISKSYVQILGPEPEPEKAKEPVKEQMGKLNVNGEFSLQCQLPEGYSMQLINSLGTKINAFITSEDVNQPILQLSIAYNELYSSYKRMNDMPQEELDLLENTFTDQNTVDISYAETAYGTKLMIVREVGQDKDFVDIMSVYEGYSIEFVMSPNPYSSNQTLTDQQIQMCIDFLSELDFVPVAKSFTFR